jgi:predicted enzyme related to lactoylglutathione lyase
MTTSAIRRLLLCGAPLLLVCAHRFLPNQQEHTVQPVPQPDQNVADAVTIQYLEIVSPDVDATCGALEKVHAVTFGKPVAELGSARTATLAGGGRIGVRAPMRDTEEPVVRPYLLVDDIEAAVKAAESAGAAIALPPMEIPGQGTCAIYILGGIQHGLWQL